MTEVRLLKLYKKKKKIEKYKKDKKRSLNFLEDNFYKNCFWEKSNSKKFWNIWSEEIQAKKNIWFSKNILYMTKERTVVRFRVKNNFIEKVNNCNLSDETGMK